MSKWKLSVLAMLTLTACSSPPPIADSACVAFKPIYATAEAVQALRPFRGLREDIAAHNQTWERICDVR